MTSAPARMAWLVRAAARRKPDNPGSDAISMISRPPARSDSRYASSCSSPLRAKRSAASSRVGAIDVSPSATARSSRLRCGHSRWLIRSEADRSSRSPTSSIRLPWRRSSRGGPLPRPGARQRRAPSARVPRVPERHAPRLRPYRHPVRAVADRDRVRVLPPTGVEDVDLAVVAAAQPQLPAVRRDPAHVGAPAAGDAPLVELAARGEVEHRDRALAPVRGVQVARVAARVEAVRALAGGNEPLDAEALGVDHPQAVG